MVFSDEVLESILLFFPLLEVALGVGVVLWGAHRLLIGRHPELGNERLFPRQLVLLGLTIASAVALVLALPVEESSRNQIIGLIGLVISGIFAFSSSTIFANLMAGIMLRVTKPFRTGDFVRVGDYFGRVAERGLLDTEVQTEARELVALPNTFMITHPVSVIRSSGTIVSATLSLGYDLHHKQVESLLLQAVKDAGLEDPFVQVLELGNYSVTYKASGLLTDVKTLLTARSQLYCSVLDTLHRAGVEIMSPAFMNQRRLGDGLRMIPAVEGPKSAVPVAMAEEVVFDKAEQAEQSEKEQERLAAVIAQSEKELAAADDAEKLRLADQISAARTRLSELIEPAAASAAQKSPEPVVPAKVEAT
ncbi:MAG TPA: mechanosensitive ion channel domain-containing protein [Malonomonas sp.]